MSAETLPSSRVDRPCPRRPTTNRSMSCCSANPRNVGPGAPASTSVWTAPAISTPLANPDRCRSAASTSVLEVASAASKCTTSANTSVPQCRPKRRRAVASPRSDSTDPSSPTNTRNSVLPSARCDGAPFDPNLATSGRRCTRYIAIGTNNGPSTTAISVHNGS